MAHKALFKGPLSVIEEACVRPKFVAESELAKMITGQTRNAFFEDADGFRAVLLIVANHDDTFCQEKEDKRIDAGYFQVASTLHSCLQLTLQAHRARR
jgi:hypothetical protein